MLPRNHLDRIQVAFDDHRLVSNAGLLLPATLALHLGLSQLVQQRLDLGDAPGRANTGDKIMTLVASALAGGDCIDDADALRAGGTAGVLDCLVKAPSTLGTFLRSFRWNVTPIGGKGQPEGIAKAPLSPNIDPAQGPFTLTYDAKSTSKANGHVTNKDVGPGRLARHRRDHDANYTLVVAPNFQRGALQDECKESKVTPMRARDLAKLLMLSATAGTLNFVEFRKVFELYDPDEVHEWVGKFIEDVESEPRISIGDLLWAFDEIGIDGPDELETTVIADRLRSKYGNKDFPSEGHVRDAIAGLSVFLPAIVRSSNKQVYLSAGPKDIRNALVEQLQLLPDSIRMSIDQDLFSEQEG